MEKVLPDTALKKQNVQIDERDRPDRPPLYAVDIDYARFNHLLRSSKGRPFVYDEGNIRSLHFEEKYVQSAMWLTAPNTLALDYTRVMMKFRRFVPAPSHIVMIGLGGGSLAKFCYRHLPQSRITVVEIDADVIALRNEFLIPGDCERFNIVHADGASFIKQAPQDVDVLMLDGFNANGQPEELNSCEFYRHCRGLLVSKGVLVANLSRDAGRVDIQMGHLQREFGDQMWQSDVPRSSNCVVFATKDGTISIKKVPRGKYQLRWLTGDTGTSNGS